MLLFELNPSPMNNINNLNSPAISQQVGLGVKCENLPKKYLRQEKARFPVISELSAVRHYTKLSQKNFSIDTHFYPLGSCTMKYNPRVANALAMSENILARHPLAPDATGQGVLACLFDLQNILSEVVGMNATSLAPMAGAQGEFAGISMIRAYHQSRGDTLRDTIIVPTAAHGTNPATATMCGYKIVEVPCLKNGNVDLEALKKVCGDNIAGLMLTNPSTLGVFESNIKELAKTIHNCGGLLYYDGANLNAIMGVARPGDMGFDVLHLNLHKTFSTPHGGGGPGAGPVSCNQKLAPFLPMPMVSEEIIANKPVYKLLSKKQCPQSIGRLSAFNGNLGILIRAYIYAKMLGSGGIREVGEFATLGANYLMAKLKNAGFECAIPERRASHEFIITLKKIKDEFGVSAMDFAKRLLDKGFHAPTTYFPMLIPECLLIEPTETESKATLDAFVCAMIEIKNEAQTNPELVKNAPHSMVIERADDVRAVKELNIRYQF